MKRVLKRVETARLRRDAAEADLINAIREARAEDLTLREIAEVAGMTHETVRKYGASSLSDARSAEERRLRSVRDKKIREDRKGGATLQSIAEKHGVTRERVRQVVAA